MKRYFLVTYQANHLQGITVGYRSYSTEKGRYINRIETQKEIEENVYGIVKGSVIFLNIIELTAQDMQDWQEQ